MSLFCPICGAPTSTQILATVTLNATIENESRSSGGLAAYQCPGGHVFFVRQIDVCTDIRRAAAS